MAAEAKALLDELMGRARNLDPSQHPDELSWSSQDVCKYFLCGFCPHELFTNTRADLGSCTKIHDEALRKEYMNSAKFERCGYEEDFIRYLQTLIADVEKRIRRGHQRLALNSQQGAMNGGNGNVNDEKIKLLTDKINNLVQQTEELGCEGKVEEAQGVMKLVDQLKEERLELETPTQDDIPMMKQMEVCEVCGAFLIVGDAPQRQDEHLMGKQHAGYAQVRSEVERRRQKVRDELEAREANEAKLKKEREDREKERQREREEKRQKERDREKERERERERKRHSRSKSRDRRRSRSRDRHRRRSSSRDRDRRRSQRSRSRDRRRRSSSRNKRAARRSSSRDRKLGHTRSRDRRSRSRNRSKDRKSRSDDKERNSEADKRRDKDRSSNKSSYKEKENKIKSPSIERHSGNHEAADVDAIKADEDKTAPVSDAASVNDAAPVNDANSGDQNEVQDAGKVSEAAILGPSGVDEAGDGPTVTEGETKIDE